MSSEVEKTGETVFSVRPLLENPQEASGLDTFVEQLNASPSLKWIQSEFFKRFLPTTLSGPTMLLPPRSEVPRRMARRSPMNWIKENKFLTGFLARTLIVAGVLACLVGQGPGRETSRATTRPRGTHAAAPRCLFPTAGNLEKDEEVKKIIMRITDYRTIFSQPISARTGDPRAVP